jgi:hypothetical protein
VDGPVKYAIALFAALVAVGLSATYETGTVGACGIAGPYDFDTFEAESYVAEYGAAIDLVTSGRAVTTTYNVGANNEVVDLRYQGLRSGPRGSRTTTLNTNLPIPPTLYKSIVWIESNYTQASNSVPFGGVGPALRSFDCGYGLGQITTGMANASGSAQAKQALIGTHYLFNLAEGVRILADKWNSAPASRPIAGEGNPAILEDWYFAIWSYNGFAFSNHPLNPIRDPLRGGSLPVPENPTPTPAATATPSATASESPSASPTASPSPTVSNPLLRQERAELPGAFGRQFADVRLRRLHLPGARLWLREVRAEPGARRFPRWDARDDQVLERHRCLDAGLHQSRGLAGV